MMSKKTARIHMRLNTEEKELMKNKANKLGFKSTSAFILDSAYNFFMIYLDLSHLSQVAKEINHVGNNINNQVHHIFATGIYSDYDLKEIQRLQKEIIIIMRREYDYLSLEKRRYSVNDKKKLINELKKHNIEIPKQILLEEVYEHIRANIKYICKLIDDSPEQEEGISDYVYECLFDGNLFELEKEILVSFSNEIYLFVEKMKIKLLNVNNVFEDDDWWEFKDILDKYVNNY